MLHTNIKHLVKENENFRQVIFSGDWSQLVVMSLSQGEEIGDEVHPSTDQIIAVVEGEGEAQVEGEKIALVEHELVFVPAGSRHNIINNGKNKLKLFTVYAPPAHHPGLIQKEKIVTEEENERVFVSDSFDASEVYKNL